MLVDVGNNDYKLAIDRTRGETRPMFNEDNIEFEEIDEDLTSIVSQQIEQLRIIKKQVMY